MTEAKLAASLLDMFPGYAVNNARDCATGNGVSQTPPGIFIGSTRVIIPNL